jgi:hypothetical protein
LKLIRKFSLADFTSQTVVLSSSWRPLPTMKRTKYCEIPARGVLKWKVTPLQSFEGRANKERSIVEALKKKHPSK